MSTTLAPGTIAIYCGTLGTALVEITGPAARDAARYDCKVIARPVWMLAAPTVEARPYLRDLCEGMTLDAAGRGSLTPLA